MKTITFFIMFCALWLNAIAQAPQKMSYQAVIRDINGNLVTNHAVGMKVSILQWSPTGTMIFQELYNPNPQTNANGLVSIEIGTGIPLTGTFSEIDWSTGPYFLKTETDPAGGTDYTIIGISQLLSVPYALYAKTAANGFSGSYNDLINKPALFDGAWANITGKPTTLTGYGIADGMSISHAANGITSVMMTNWNTAYGWGNHAGLYKPTSYLPSWSEITGIPSGIADGVDDVDDADADPNNEIQVLSKSGNTITLSKNGGSFIDEVNDTDSNPTNEIQTLTLSGTQLTISGAGGNTVNLTNWDTNETDDVKLSGNQTIAGNKTFTGTISAGSKTVTNVANPVNAQDAATKAYVDMITDKLIKTGFFVADVEGNLYTAIKIGTQTWMSENLKTTKYNDGTAIPLVTDAMAWANLTTPGYCWYNYDNATYGNIYGAFYNWYTVNTGKLCPTGWHVPIDAEWTTLTTYLGGETVAGGKMKETGTTHWQSPNTGATNESGFSGLPGGHCQENGAFSGVGGHGNWWSSEYSSTDAWHRGLYNLDAKLYRINYVKKLGFNIRCVRDCGPITDIEGNVYSTIQIGTQTWMAENLETTKYNDGTAIPLVTDNTAWVNLTTPGYCWYNNDKATYGNIYGALYNWYTVNTGKLCPTGWHVPSDAEWTTLTTFLGGESVAGGKMKETGTTHWTSPNTGATNESGFSGLPGGDRDDGGNFLGIGGYAYWWSSTETSTYLAWYRYLIYNYTLVYRSNYLKYYGFSVRCVRDF